MPRGDGTGPMDQGPGIGRGMGFGAREAAGEEEDLSRPRRGMYLS